MTARVVETGTILDRIVARTVVDVDTRKSAVDVDELRSRSRSLPAPVDVRAALKREHVTIIAEFKRASPSRGRFPVDVDPADVAASYIRGGATAISCLTDGPFFQGSLDDLEAIAMIARPADPPVGVLRKDFIIDRYQIDEARACGASCILLIAACLDDERMRDLREYAIELGLSVLVEVHDEPELERALSIGADMIGINNRDLRTFDVDLQVTTRLAAHLPSNIVVVGESGIFSREDVESLAAAGVDAVLVGESLILQHDRVAAVGELSRVEKSERVKS